MNRDQINAKLNLGVLGVGLALLIVSAILGVAAFGSYWHGRLEPCLIGDGGRIGGCDSIRGLAIFSVILGTGSIGAIAVGIHRRRSR